MTDEYEGFAERYDLFHGGFGQHNPLEVDFFRALVQKNQLHSVLDCACGTGYHLHLFHSLGCEVVGSDISPSMLAQAARNLAAGGVDVPLHQADYRELPRHFQRQFDAVLCLSSSILHMPDEAQVTRAFSSMRAVLRQGGVLILTQGTTDKQWREKPRFIVATDDKDLTRLFVIDYLGQGTRYNILDIFHRAGAPELKVWSADYPRVYLKDDLSRLLAASGFDIIDIYGNFRFEPYDKQTSDRLIIVAQR
jgi:glycine/sarcosine N-methyltransferase